MVKKENMNRILNNKTFCKYKSNELILLKKKPNKKQKKPLISFCQSDNYVLSPLKSEFKSMDMIHSPKKNKNNVFIKKIDNITGKFKLNDNLPFKNISKGELLSSSDNESESVVLNSLQTGNDDNDKEKKLNGNIPHAESVDNSHEESKCVSFDSEYKYTHLKVNDNEDSESEKDSVSNTDNDVNGNFMDDEAVEDNDYFESDDELMEDEDQLQFEGGSYIKPSHNASSRLTINNILDLYQTDSEEYDTDLDDFVVDDSFVEYDTDVNGIESECGRDKFMRRNKRKYNRIKVHSDSSSDEDIPQSIPKLDYCIPDTNLSSPTAKDQSFMSKNLVTDISNCSSESLYDYHLYRNKDKLSSNEKIIQNNSTIKSNLDKENLKDLSKSMSIWKSDNSGLGIVSVQVSHQDSCLKNNMINLDEDFKTAGMEKLSKFEEIENNDRLCTRPMNKISNFVKCSTQDHKNILEIDKHQLADDLNNHIVTLITRLTESDNLEVFREFNYSKSKKLNEFEEIFSQILFQSLLKNALISLDVLQKYALCVMIFSANISLEVAAVILTKCTLYLIENIQRLSIDQMDCSSKELNNVTLFICYLYEFGIMNSSLIFDILEKICENGVKEKQVDLMQDIFSSVLFKLNKSDPVALKNIISEIQSKTSFRNVFKDKMSAKIKLFLNIFTKMQKNNFSHIPNYNLYQCRKRYKRFLKRHVQSRYKHPFFQVSLNDIIQSNGDNKWWATYDLSSNVFFRENGSQKR